MNWTDDKVKEFVKVYTIGKYWDDYRDCVKIDEKLKRFKLINKGEQMKSYANPIEKLIRYLNWVNGITFAKDVYQKEHDSYTSDKFEQNFLSATFFKKSLVKPASTFSVIQLCKFVQFFLSFTLSHFDGLKA